MKRFLVIGFYTKTETAWTKAYNAVDAAQAKEKANNDTEVDHNKAAELGSVIVTTFQIHPHDASKDEQEEFVRMKSVDG